MSQLHIPSDLVAQVLVDRQGVVQFWSLGCERFFGYAENDVIGQSVEFLAVPAYRERHKTGFEASMARMSAERPQSAGNIPVLHADGSVLAHPFRQIQLCDAFGRSTGAIVIFSQPLKPGEANGLRDLFVDALHTFTCATAS